MCIEMTGKVIIKHCKELMNFIKENKLEDFERYDFCDNCDGHELSWILDLDDESLHYITYEFNISNGKSTIEYVDETIKNYKGVETITTEKALELRDKSDYVNGVKY